MSGLCTICGSLGAFEDSRESPREGYECAHCGASMRYRHQAEALLHAYSRCGSASLEELAKEADFSGMKIYEPGIIGPFRQRLKHLPEYVQSYHWEDAEPGEFRHGIRAENLESLSFGDESLDLVISSDIFEHIRRPMAAFREILRVLKPGGKHVFTVPVGWPWQRQTVARVDVSTSEDKPILPPVYHRSPTNPAGSLVYNDFGMDLVERLEEMGFDVRVPGGACGNLTFVTTRRSAVVAKKPRKKPGFFLGLLR